MKKFILKIFSLVLFLFLLFIIFLSHKSTYKVSIINEKSIDSADIVILGDSRADRQINPQILHFYTNLNCLNIAESSLDLYALSKRLINLNLTNKILIISASSWQINDGSIEAGYFRPETFNDLTFRQKISMYRTLPTELFNNQVQIFKQFNKLSIGNDSRFINKNYNEIQCHEFVIPAIIKNHPWYRKINTNGIKKKLLLESLLNLNNISCKKIVIYNSPVCDQFKINAQRNDIWQMEEEYNRVVSDIIKKNGLSKIVFYNLINLGGFKRSDYYDPQHFCESGAAKFSAKIDSIFKLKDLFK